jgi:hypothetical protein
MAADLGYDVISGSHGQFNLGQAFSSLSDIYSDYPCIHNFFLIRDLYREE